VAVKTIEPKKLSEWRGIMQSIREDMTSQDTGWEQEIAFVEALIAILDDKPVIIRQDSSYNGMVKKAQTTINNFQRGESHE
jgi:hypothetical protein